MYRIIGGDKQEYGPASAEEMRQWIAEGRLSGETLAREDTSPHWLKLAEFPEFEKDLAVQAERFLLQEPSVAPVANPDHRPHRFSVVECLSRGMQLWLENFFVISAACLTVWALSTALQLLPFMGLVYWVLKGVLYGGLSIVVLKRIRGQHTQPREVFTGFGGQFMQLALVGMATSLLTSFGLILCILPGVYLTILWIFSIPAVADSNLEFWPAMELSRKTVHPLWPKIFVLTLIAFLPTVLVNVYMDLTIFNAVRESMKSVTPGSVDFSAMFQQMTKSMEQLAPTLVPLVWLSKCILLCNLPFGICALLSAYESLLGQTKARR